MFGSKARTIKHLYSELVDKHTQQARLLHENRRLGQEVENWKETAAQFARNTEYYQGLLDNIAENFGIEAYISQDGSLQDEPLRAKMPDLVSQLLCEKTMMDMILYGQSIIVII